MSKIQFFLNLSEIHKKIVTNIQKHEKTSSLTYPFKYIKFQIPLFVSCILRKNNKNNYLVGDNNELVICMYKFYVSIK